MITITIDGKKLQVAPGTSVLAAALDAGIDIPRLCYHKHLLPTGHCRLCVVDVVGFHEPQPACTLAAKDGLVVSTRNEELYKRRKMIIDMLLSDHPMNCTVCDKSGACSLQKYAYDFGMKETTLNFECAREGFKQDDNPFLLRDHQYCILCGRCTRVCDEVVGADAIEFSGRGFESHIATPFNEAMSESACVFCGSCVQVCPTAALMPKVRLGRGREWEFPRIDSVCGYCGVGCRVQYALKPGVEGGMPNGHREIVYAQGYKDAAVNDEFLCTKGRYGWDFASNKERLTRPLVRKDLAKQLGLSDEDWAPDEASPLQTKGAEKNFIPVAWDKALEIITDKLVETIEQNGPDSVAGLASARCTNEDNYVFQKVMRAAIGTNNVDHCARLCHASTVAGLAQAFGSGAMTNGIKEVRDADCVFITGSNTSEAHPVIGYEVVRAVKQGASLVVVDPRRVPITEHARLHLQPTPGTDIFVFMAMMHVILREDWIDKSFISKRTEGFDEFKASVSELTPEIAAEKSGVAAADIELAARLYALGERRSGVSKYGDDRGRSTILYSMGITQRSNGTNLVMTLANLAMMAGHLGKRSSGVNPLRGQSNVQGACDLGALPNVFPGYQKVGDEDARAKVAKVWKVPSLPDQAGLTVVEQMRAVEAGDVKALLIMGENPMMSDPNINHVEKALRSAAFVVVSEIFLSETAQLAHVVLPAASSLEKDGTFTNTERRVQKLNKVLHAPGESREDYLVYAELGRRICKRLKKTGINWNFASTAAVMNEISAAAPQYGGISHERLGPEGLTWPCPTADHPGTPILHTEKFTRGKGKFYAGEPSLPAELTDAEYPFVLTTGRMLYHYHTGTMTRRSHPLSWKEPKGYVEINEADAERLGLTEDKPVVIESRRGRIRTRARIGERVAEGVVFVPFHYREAAANLLTQDEALDPVAKIPELKVCAVRVENPAAKSAKTAS